MDWFFHTRVWREMHQQRGGDTGVDNEIAKQGFESMGAWILGRNMFGPVRGHWPDDNWKGWWGSRPFTGTDEGRNDISFRSMKCTSRFGRYCSVPESHCSPGSICASWATHAHGMQRESVRCMCS